MTWLPLAPEHLRSHLVERIAALDGVARVAIDAPPCADPLGLARSLDEPLRVLGRPVTVIDSHLFWRDASVRLEYGHEDVESYPQWLDHGALQREVLVAARERGEYLPSLRDPASDRSTHAAPEPLAPNGVVIVAGELLLGLGLTFDHVIHLTVSRAARARRTSAETAWTLPAFDGYDETVHPADLADVVVKFDDPAHPVLRSS